MSYFILRSAKKSGLNDDKRFRSLPYCRKLVGYCHILSVQDGFMCAESLKEPRTELAVWIQNNYKRIRRKVGKHTKDAGNGSPMRSGQVSFVIKSAEELWKSERKICVTAECSGHVSRFRCMGGYQMVRQTEYLTEQDKTVFLNGIRKYMDRGIPVYMDGKRTDEKRLRRLFEPQGKFFYMADFVIEEAEPETAGMIRERNEAAGSAGNICGEMTRDTEGKGLYLNERASRRFRLKAIHFDRVYHQ